VRGGQLDFPDGECQERQVIIGVPGDDIGTTKNAGAVASYFGRDRNAFCLPGAGFNLGANAHPRDRLGAAVGRLSNVDSPDHLLLGIPGLDVGTAVDAGVVLKGSTVYMHSDGAVSGAHYGAVLNR
jgi:hypothetical protein